MNTRHSGLTLIGAELSSITIVVVILCYLSAVIQSHADALDHWHLRRPPQSTNYLSAVTYANGLFVAVGRSGARGEILTSPDGVVWTSHTLGTTNEPFEVDQVAYGNDRFVTIGTSADGFVSTNGVDWITATNPSAGAEHLLGFGNGVFVAANPGFVSTSPDGLNWSVSQTHSIRTHPEDIIYAGGRFVIVGRNPFIMVPSVWASTNGTDWFASGPVASQSEGLFAVTWGGGLFVAAGFGRNLVSLDGQQWSASTGPAYFAEDLTFWDGIFVAVGRTVFPDSAAHIQTSTNGVQWQVRDSGWTNGLLSVAYGSGTFVAVGEGGAILQSDDTRARLTGRIDANTGAVELSVTGGLVRSYRLQAAANLPATNWTDLLTFTNTAPATSFVDTDTTHFSWRFYRVVSP